MAWAAWGYAAEISYEPVGPRAFPLLLAAILALIGAWMLIKGNPVARIASAPETRVIGAAEAATATEPSAPEPSRLAAVVLCAAAVLIYGAIFQPLGFVLATALMTIPVCKAFGGSYKGGVIGGIALGLSLYFLFDKLLDVVLPTGVLSFILGGR